MIANFFDKSKPAVIFITGILLFFFYTIALFSFKWEQFSVGFIFEKLTVFFGLIVMLLITNFVIGKNNLTQDNSYALLLIVLLLGTFYETFFSNTILFAIITLLLGFRKVYSLKSGLKTKIKLFDAGFWIGVATLIYSWSIVYMLLIYVAILVFQKGSFKNIFVPIVGFATPVFIFFTYCFALDKLPLFQEIWNFNYSLTFESYNQLKFIIPIAFVSIIALLSIFSITPKVVLIGKKLKQNWNVLLFHLLVSVFLITFSPVKNGSEMFFMVFPVSVIVANFIQQLNSENVKNVLIYLFVAVAISVYFL